MKQRQKEHDVREREKLKKVEGKELNHLNEVEKKG